MSGQDESSLCVSGRLVSGGEIMDNKCGDTVCIRLEVFKSVI